MVWGLDYIYTFHIYTCIYYYIHTSTEIDPIRGNSTLKPQRPTHRLHLRPAQPDAAGGGEGQPPAVVTTPLGDAVQFENYSVRRTLNPAFDLHHTQRAVSFQLTAEAILFRGPNSHPECQWRNNFLSNE